jgi:hypothetical protein
VPRSSGKGGDSQSSPQTRRVRARTHHRVDRHHQRSPSGGCGAGIPASPEIPAKSHTTRPRLGQSGDLWLSAGRLPAKGASAATTRDCRPLRQGEHRDAPGGSGVHLPRLAQLAGRL